MDTFIAKRRSAAIMVLYYPEIEKIQKSISIIVEEVGELILVDNTPESDISEYFINKFNIRYIPLKENLGIAKAQNIGLKAIDESDYSHIFFFDQDSDIDRGYVQNMLSEYLAISRKYHNLFILGPTIINGRSNQEYSSFTEKTADEIGFSPSIAVISSGSCINKRSLKEVGLLDEDLFIDGVDHEWCMRAVSKGLICGETRNVSLTHYVGQKSKKVLGIEIIVSSPIRYYYQTRNWLWLLRRGYIPITWKLKTSLKKIYIYSLLWIITPNRRKIYKHIFRGFRDGVTLK